MIAFLISLGFIAAGLGLAWYLRRKRRRELAVLYGGTMAFKDRKFDPPGPTKTIEVHEGKEIPF